MDEKKEQDAYFKGRGSQINTSNKFLKNRYVTEHDEVLDEPLLMNEKTQVFLEHPKKIVNQVKSPDIPGMYSMNPYQGCEHGCIYCYARNTHEYWGYSAGIEFEQKIRSAPFTSIAGDNAGHGYWQHDHPRSDCHLRLIHSSL